MRGVNTPKKQPQRNNNTYHRGKYVEEAYAKITKYKKKEQTKKSSSDPEISIIS